MLNKMDISSIQDIMAMFASTKLFGLRLAWIQVKSERYEK